MPLNTSIPVEIVDLESARTHARVWLFEHAAPLWASAGVHSDGMFAERLDLQGNPVVMNRRLRVQARQIYSFCAIGSLGWDGPWRERVEQAVNIMIGKGRRADGLFIHLYDPSGAVIRTELDLYDHAFGLFALAHAGKALNRPDLFDIADTIQDQLDAKWKRPEGGYWEGELTPCPPYRQNPHMHMLETALAHYQASGRTRWQEMAQELRDVFRSKFWHAETGAVTEYFDKSWSRLDEDGDVVEPGHCLEWAWLFEVGFNDVELSDGLTGFARKHGLNRDRGVAINEVLLDGAVRDGAARLWPQTERLKAAMARFSRTGSAAEADEAVAAYKGLALYFDVPKIGVWRDRMNADGSWLEEAAPASSFYHIVCALTELLK